MTDPITPAQRLASNHVAAFTNNQRAYWTAKKDGVPARKGLLGQSDQPAISADEYVKALGAENIATFDKVYGAAAPTT